MTVWVVRHECDDQFYDQYYPPHLIDIFLTLDLAKEFVSKQNSYDQAYYSISEVEIKESVK